MRVLWAINYIRPPCHILKNKPINQQEVNFTQAQFRMWRWEGSVSALLPGLSGIILLLLFLTAAVLIFCLIWRETHRRLVHKKMLCLHKAHPHPLTHKESKAQRVVLNSELGQAPGLLTVPTSWVQVHGLHHIQDCPSWLKSLMPGVHTKEW